MKNFGHRAALLGQLVVAGSALGLGGCNSGNRSGQKAAPPPVPVVVSAAEQRNIAVLVNALATVEPVDSVTVRSRVDGEIMHVGFREGDAVKKGDILFVIDPRAYEANLKQARAQLQRDQALLTNATQERARYQGLAEKEYVTEEQLQATVAQESATRAAVAADQAAVDNAALMRDYCYVRAPLGGRTGSLLVKAGNLVHASEGQPLVVINQMQPIDLRFAVPEQYFEMMRAKLRDGGVGVTATPRHGVGPSLSGEVRFVDNAVDQTTGSILVKASFANQDESLWPGQFVDVTVGLGEEAGAVSVPATAVQSGQQGPYVFVVKPDQTAELRQVSVGATADEMTAVEKGLAVGEQVVTDGQMRLMPGSRVVIKAQPTTVGALKP